MYLLYSLVLSLLFLALLPYFVYQAARRGKYSGSFKERMGLLPGSLRGDARDTIWVHAVSVGEFLAARPLIARLKHDLPAARIVVSTTTLTGQRLARSQSHLFDAALYFPFDWKFSVRHALAWVKPSVVIILETELWPNFLRECRRRGVVTVLANGRISPRSFRRYQLLGRPFRRAVEDFSLMVMQSESDAERARQLGAPSGRLRVCGNLKYDSPEDGRRGLAVGEEAEASSGEPGPKPTTRSIYSGIDHQFALSLSPHLIVAGSTAPGEEEMLLASLREVRRHAGLEDARLLLAPRHPERFDEVARLIARSGFSFVRRSESRGSSESSVPRPGASAGESSVETQLRPDEAASDGAQDVILLDTIGELASIYRFAAVVFVGGSLVPRGGHNIIEPAAFAKPIVVGPHTENFRQIVSDFARADAVVQIRAAGNDVANRLARELIRLLSDHEHARAIGERAREILLKNRGATDCTVAAIRELMRIEE
ncbi:MAG TPA: 3-deoxy-D-manno-octulosonic acid transferase [Blastocatellia bacterium]|nr:3-deoxy-D-manno-octulosonic acid transferase [Blastocatellia bacterium]